MLTFSPPSPVVRGLQWLRTRIDEAPGVRRKFLHYVSVGHFRRDGPDWREAQLDEWVTRSPLRERCIAFGSYVTSLRRAMYNDEFREELVAIGLLRSQASSQLCREFHTSPDLRSAVGKFQDQLARVIQCCDLQFLARLLLKAVLRDEQARRRNRWIFPGQTLDRFSFLPFDLVVEQLNSLSRFMRDQSRAVFRNECLVSLQDLLRLTSSSFQFVLTVAQQDTLVDKRAGGSLQQALFGDADPRLALLTGKPQLPWDVFASGLFSFPPQDKQ